MSKKKTSKIKKIKVRVVGIGGGGGSIVSKISKKVKKASFCAIDTDARALKRLSRKVKKIRLGKEITHGLGTGMDFEMGKKIAKKEKDKIKKIFKGQDIIILIGCLGGGFASGTASYLARKSKRMGNITYGVFTLPFKFEGSKKKKIAKKALKKIRKSVNAYSYIPNDRIFRIIEKSAPLKKALAVINEHLSQSIRGLLEIIYGTGIINIDYADLKTIFSGKGKLAYLNSIRVKKKDSREKVFESITSSPLYPYTIERGKNVLFNISAQRNLSLAQVNKVAEAISEKVSRSAKIIFGISKSKKVTITRVNLLVVGCKGRKKKKKKKKKKKRKKKTKKIKDFKGLSKERIKKIKIKELGLPSKTTSLLTSDRIKTIAGLIRRTRESLLDIKGMGKARLEKVNKVLKKLGVSLKKSEKKKVKKKVKKKTKEEKEEEKKKEEKVETRKIRKNALQVKEDLKKAKKEIISKENMWEKPTFLRKNKQ